MSAPMNRTVSFAPTGPYSPYFPQFQYTLSYTPPEKSVRDRVTHYVLRALSVIEKIIRLLRSSSPFFEQYSPVLKQLPNMYKMIKLIQEVQQEDVRDTNDHNDKAKNEVRERRQSKEPRPTLFI